MKKTKEQINFLNSISPKRDKNLKNHIQFSCTNSGSDRLIQFPLSPSIFTFADILNTSPREDKFVTLESTQSPASTWKLQRNIEQRTKSAVADQKPKTERLISWAKSHLLLSFDILPLQLNPYYKNYHRKKLKKKRTPQFSFPISPFANLISYINPRTHHQKDQFYLLFYLLGFFLTFTPGKSVYKTQA